MLATMLAEAGHDAIHVRDVGLSSADDATLLEFARESSRIVISADTDFGALLALGPLLEPSVILFRSRSYRTASAQFEVLNECLPMFLDLLEAGCVLVISDEYIRARRLPLLPR